MVDHFVIKRKKAATRKNDRGRKKAREDSKNKSTEDVSESMSMGNIHIGGLESHLLDVPDLELARYVVPTGRYVVPTGRVVATDSVIVATSGYVVPAAYDISSGLKDLSRAETYKWYQSQVRVSVEE
ncbi:hypothetical protein Tco_1074079 [Tanacetum coccineum]